MHGREYRGDDRIINQQNQPAMNELIEMQRRQIEALQKEVEKLQLCLAQAKSILAEGVELLENLNLNN